ncbi:MAG: P-loop NTPase fold protein [Bacteroides graminisolvens]|uniref:KAP family P-loop NTPase fold protein n=1 Tax=Bacteroides graminisolvens TaxID=477666 RepID=UPI003A84C046
MWTDNTTDKDFLGFDVHANLIKELIKDEKMLPLTIGLFGDWGSGKSSILEVLKNEIEKESKTACLYFNGWVFEGYDDAKAALLETILKEFEDEKKFGVEIQDQIKKLFKSVKWMRVIGFGIKNIVLPTAAAYMTGGLSLISQLADGLKNAAEDPDGLVAKIKEHDTEAFLKQFVTESEDTGNFDVVRKFRDDFEELLKKSKIDKLVIIIDDLDRCLPDRIIDNLEAIKLFLNVKNTAFIIGADPRIVRHAIEYRYKDKIIDTNAENTNDRIVNDYLEKLIQIPYTLPKLSDSEVETYITLLFCENDLESADDFNKVLEAFKKFRSLERYSVFDFAKVKDAVGDASKTDKLEQNVSLIAKLSPIISESLYGNPRQIKRFLNTFMLRKKLATVAHIKDFRDDILAKLMILEYAEPKLFEILYNWQISNQGIATQLVKLEEICCKKGDGQLTFTDDLKGWNKPKIVNWMSSEPLLSKIDLRDYYWISRDKLSSMQSNLLVPPVVKSLMTKLEPDGMAEKLTIKILNEELKVLNGNYQSAFFSLLKQRIITEPDKNRYYELFNIALREGFDCKSIYVESLTSAGRRLPPAAIESLKKFTGTHAEFNQFVEIKQKGKI